MYIIIDMSGTRATKGGLMKFNKESVCWKPGSDALFRQNLSGNLKGSLWVSSLNVGNVVM